jgi:hypothetical protein
MRPLKQIIACALLAANAGCAQYLVVAQEPRYAGQPHQRVQVSSVGTVSSPPQVIARECGPGEQLAMVVVTRNFGQGLAAFLTLGLYAPARIEYRCATEVQPQGGEINTSGGS